MLKKIRRRVIENDLLYLLAEIGIATFAVSAPPLAMIGFVIQAAQKHTERLSARKIRNSFYSLKKRGLLVVEYKHGKTALMLTPEAERLVHLKNLQSAFEKKKVKPWHGRWFVVMFDINNRKTAARNALRSLLQKFGFIYLQKSAWVYPYDCQPEIKFLKSFFELRDSELRVLICNSIGNDKNIRAHFGI